ncbi:hypothetical protein A3Q56_04798 [Intoshia linei]|uniref:14-3-3 domain-containing protein n=1 Tax=Intoshia linei TaxID=1819745 RepID=A0A177B005_9BILA|nr:hypothetical protein A3Q56_04798 [Intoshia linei]
MVKKTKLGKSRKDKFYKLSKEIGYRSRASFKLLQLERKYHFLAESRICVDLCAAPGSWLQVAANHMPVSSLLIGCDLVHIKPITNCITFESDITTEKCKQRLKSELHNWKADLFLHDGAPNVGQSWIHDAYQQVKLSLSAFKLACSFLRRGGCFVTKVFRSKDYNSLLYAFRELFVTVTVTKPSASRNESCEIYVICQNFKAPTNIDSKLFDPSFVFEEKSTNEAGNDMYKSRLFKNLSRKTKADGYEDDSVYHVTSDLDFIKTTEPIHALANFNKIDIITDVILSDPATSEDIKEYCSDLKLIGKPEIKNLIKWRRKIIQNHFTESENVDHVAEDKLEQEKLKYDRRLEYISLEENREVKRKLKKQKKLKKRNELKTQLKSRDREGIDAEETSEKMFSLASLQNKSKKYYTSDEESNAEVGASEAESFNENLIVDIADKNKKRKDVVAKWFNKDVFKSTENDENDDEQKCDNNTEIDIIVPKQNPELKTKKAKFNLTPIQLALGEKIVESKKQRLEIIEDSFNRYANNDKNLPDWFMDDEKKHMTKNVKADETRINYYAERDRAVDTKTITKSVQAKMRKKKRQFHATQKARKLAENITDNLDMNEGEKWQSIKKIYKKAGLLSAKKKENVTYIVCKQGAGKKVKRPKGVKGRFKVVDARMKKDNRKKMKMKTFEMAKKCGCTELDDRNLLSVSCKNVVGNLRASCRMINSVLAQHVHVMETECLTEDPVALQKKQLILDYRAGIVKDITRECIEVIELVVDYVISKCPPDNHEHKCFFLKMVGDYYRYYAECLDDGVDKNNISDKSDENYKKAYELAKQHLPCTNSVRLGLVLNYSVFHYEIKGNQTAACDLARVAFDEAIAELDTLSEDSYKDSTLIMQLLRDNLTLWTSDVDDEQKDEKDEETKEES